MNEITQMAYPTQGAKEEVSKIEVHAFWSNEDWYSPSKTIDLSQYDHIELLQEGFKIDVFIAWNGSDKKTGRLFKGKWNSGKI